MNQLEFEFVKDLKSKDQIRKEEEDKEMKALYKSNAIKLNKIMDFYQIPYITREEIYTLCNWS